MRQNCKIATSEEGMEKLMDHTLHRQMTRLEVQNAELQSQVSRLTGLMENQLLLGRSTVHNHTNIAVQQNLHVNVVGFNQDGRIRLAPDLVKAAFTENPLLVEYCRMTDADRTDAKKAAPYVLEALLELTRRAHGDPVYRNIYLSPHRADQVMVCLDKGQNRPQHWEVRPLLDAIRILFDGVADGLQRIIVSGQERSQLPLDVQGAASWVPNLYGGSPDRYVNDGKGRMAAHLQNLRP